LGHKKYPVWKNPVLLSPQFKDSMLSNLLDTNLLLSYDFISDLNPHLIYPILKKKKKKKKKKIKKKIVNILVIDVE